MIIQDNMSHLEIINLTVTNYTEKVLKELSNKEFKRMIMTMFKQLKEDKKMTELRKSIQDVKIEFKENY